MKRLLSVLLLTLAGIVAADELSDANRLLLDKSYAKAFPIYQRLADAGNAEAQLRLGEMYWFGDGTAPDLGKARLWFEKSASAGNADAAASLASLKRRETHGAEITYWTTTYQGEDMVGGRFACKRPVFPAVSKTKAEITAVEKSIAEWRSCHNGLVANLNDALPPGKRIPTEVVDMMTPAEAAQAQRHLDTVYGKIIGDANQEATRFTAEEAAWVRATREFVETEAQRTEAVKAEMQRTQQNMQRMDTPIPRVVGGGK